MNGMSHLCWSFNKHERSAFLEQQNLMSILVCRERFGAQYVNTHSRCVMETHCDAVEINVELVFYANQRGLDDGMVFFRALYLNLREKESLPGAESTYHHNFHKYANGMLQDLDSFKWHYFHSRWLGN